MQPLAAGAAVGLCAIGLAWWNPGDQGVPLCPTKALTGIDCPLCGGLRAVAALMRFDIGRAADHNILVVALAPLALAWWVTWLASAWRRRPMPRLPWNRTATVCVALALVAFTVVRNLPAGGWVGWLRSDAA